MARLKLKTATKPDPAPSEGTTEGWVVAYAEWSLPRWHDGRRISAFLSVFSTFDQMRGDCLGEILGVFRLPDTATRHEIEAEALRLFGGHAGESGPPALASLQNSRSWDSLLGKVAVARLSRPAASVAELARLVDDDRPIVAKAVRKLDELAEAKSSVA